MVTKKPIKPIVSLNPGSDILKSLTPEHIGKIIASSQSCNDRCGCVGINCDCRGQVGGRVGQNELTLPFDDMTLSRKQKIDQLRAAINALERGKNK